MSKIGICHCFEILIQMARIYGVFELQFSWCGGRVRLVGFITEPAPVRQILEPVASEQQHR